MNVKNTKLPQPRFRVDYSGRFRMKTYGEDNLYPQHLQRIVEASGTATLNELFLYVKAISDSYNFGTLNHPIYQHVQVYPGSCGYELFRR